MNGAIVQKVDRPVPSFWAFTVRLPGRTVTLVAIGGARPIVGEVPVELVPRVIGRTPAAEVMRWRRALEGSRVVRCAADRLTVVRGGEQRTVVATREGVTLVELGSDGSDGAEGEVVDATEALRAHLESLRAERKRAIASALLGAIKKARRKIEAVRGDLAQIGRADEWVATATLLSSNAHAVKKGATSITVDDWSSGEAVQRTITLDPSRTAREQADALFHRTKRLKRGVAIAAQRLAEAERAEQALIAIRDALEDANDDRALEVIEKRAAAANVRVAKQTSKRAHAPERRPHREFRVGEDTIHVGKNARDNDVLTTKIARPHDVWLHAKNVHGAHVVVPLAKGKPIRPELLIDAAHLAAHFSDARDESVVDVQWTEKRYVRKPKGAAPGAVTLEREKVIVLRLEKARLARLLASEINEA